jgi:hypothetical protein
MALKFFIVVVWIMGAYNSWIQEDHIIGLSVEFAVKAFVSSVKMDIV